MEKQKKKIIFIIGAVFVLVLVFFATSDKLTNMPHVPEMFVDEDPITMLFVGDIMLDRGVRNAINREGSDYPLENIAELLRSADISVGNLEGVFTDNPSISVVDNSVLRFTFDPTLVEMLKSYGFSGMSLANNHAMDFGREGFDNTKTLLTNNAIFSFGSPSNDIDISARQTVGEEEVCFVGYHSLYKEDTSPVLSEITKLKDSCSFIVVVAHWGEEYKDEENAAQRRQGRSFVDAGADLVIGHHPHVVQPVEIYNGKAIFYSLGNFLFDQDFSLATRQSLAVRLTLGRDYQEFHLIPLEMSRARVYYPEQEAYEFRKGVLVSKLPPDLKTTAMEDSVFVLPR
jgi:poly-gamma-glutamate synthesis protein (capsule biosynthesis protein)